MKGIIETIHEAWPGTKIILLGVLPRGTDYWDGGSGRTSWPNVLTPAINSLNDNLKVQCRGSPLLLPLPPLEGAMTGWARPEVEPFFTSPTGRILDFHPTPAKHLFEEGLARTSGLPDRFHISLV